MTVLRNQAGDPLNIDANGYLQVKIAGGGGGGGGPTDIASVGGNAVNSTLPVSGTVAVSNHPSSISVSNFPATQTVSGTVNAAQSGSWTVGVNNFPASQAVTGTFWQATQPVSLTSTVRALEPVHADADILANSVTVANSLTQTTIITIPAGRLWVGDITGWVYASGTAAATTANALIRTLGTGVAPAAGTVVGYMLTHLAGTAGHPATYVFNNVRVKAPPGNSVTLTVTNSLATLLVSSVSANGVLL